MCNRLSTLPDKVRVGLYACAWLSMWVLLVMAHIGPTNYFLIWVIRQLTEDGNHGNRCWGLCKLTPWCWSRHQGEHSPRRRWLGRARCHSTDEQNATALSGTGAAEGTNQPKWGVLRVQCSNISENQTVTCSISICRIHSQVRLVYLVKQCILPQSEHHHVRPVSGPKRGEEVLRMKCNHL